MLRAAIQGSSRFPLVQTQDVLEDTEEELADSQTYLETLETQCAEKMTEISSISEAIASRGARAGPH